MDFLNYRSTELLLVATLICLVLSVKLLRLGKTSRYWKERARALHAEKVLESAKAEDEIVQARKEANELVEKVKKEAATQCFVAKAEVVKAEQTVVTLRRYEYLEGLTEYLKFQLEILADRVENCPNNPDLVTYYKNQVTEYREFCDEMLSLKRNDDE
ncbi:hypothetical protein AD45P2_00415 [Alteromonas phage vB_AmaP_AD45-P2]|uniref:Uncharacterized protein n=1 Tax=Pseudorhizobium pelagicum TaxID=1509405 RepID=A0A922P0J1_9HYPH|nr:hypothetical protein [Pseudorhizobium pelagicum]YP_008126053.1 hypothetical protein M610_gp099 [Alteromonas phage vB_AmaP_AD45-P1]AGM47016.1 hypothetical protein AD45P3_00390 [Alteromonas phage vB_AmaP_AD45-P3]AGM47132.1 hypothetical protein AD45P4_00385 [Alteromonas phage vB_AmaP_AD45-P4]AGM47254.1 hypothetical protein AD45P2_00415 [Alteromonas phage vB_AmaP_AD45-P2]AGM46900.1 hypothetical protein AD45P1_00410 [Alteromonas phage vB_AmaP_AD45-P1]KEQ05626.1 hypothetical protein GV68_08845 [